MGQKMSSKLCSYFHQKWWILYILYFTR